MPPIKRLSDTVSTSGWLSAAEFADVKVLGFDSVINFRPDGETPDQISSAKAQLAAEAAGLQYIHIPVTKHELFADESVTQAAQAFAGHGRVLAYCTSGLRAAILWAAASARTTPVAGVMSSLHDAGFELRFIRDDLDEQAERARWQNEAEKSAAAVANREPERASEAAA